MDEAISPALSPEQRRRFDERGLVRLEGAVAPHAAEAMADRLWTDLAARFGARRNDPMTWSDERPAAFRALQDSGAFEAMGSPRVREALDELMGPEAWTEPTKWGQPLVSFPGHATAWTVPHKSWHLDGPATPHAGSHIRMGRVFVILAPLARRGGGTLIAEGSHKIVQAITDRHGRALSSGEMRAQLQAEHPWFRDLEAPGEPAERIARFMETDTPALGTALRLAEMTGEPGDVWLMHPDCLHAAAPNVLKTPRLALTQFVSLRAV